MRWFSFYPYVLIGSAILTWWGIAFFPRAETTAYDFPTTAENIPHTLSILDTFAPIDRQELFQALHGDVAVMTKLIANWEIEAQILEKEGIHSLSHLKKESFLRSQRLGRKLQWENHSERKKADFRTYRRLLPQTYASASFLFALTDPESILAIPSGLRAQTALCPLEMTNKIPHDVGTHSSEQLNLLQPEIAFLAEYSHPSTVEALRNQGIRLVTLSEVRDVEDLFSNLILVGKTINEPFKAELLSLFIEAALYAIDNRVAALRQLTSAPEDPNILYLCYHTHYSTPSSRTLTGKLLHRLGINNHVSRYISPALQNQWKIPLNYEEILALSPDSIIFSSDSPMAIRKHLHNDPALCRLPAVKKGKVSIVDETVQESPTQFIVLAYFDLYEAMLK